MNSTITQPALRCPKCHGDLVVYERQGIVVDQCRDCRGIWLDRGELDHLIDLEAAYVGRMSRSDGAPGPDGRDARHEDRYADRDRGRDDRDRGRDDRDRDRDGDRRRADDRDDDRPRRTGDRRANLFGDIFGDILGG